MNKKILNEMRKFMILLGVLIILIVSASAQTFETPANPAQATTCCEKTSSGAWCMNALQTSCDSSYRSTFTSCDSTSFCKAGCCYDSQEGMCMENTPQRVCQASGGIWADDAQCNIAQCQMGCCVLGSQASLTTLVRCKKLSATYGLLTDFRTNIQDEPTCLAVANDQDVGACVYEVDFSRTCKFTTRGDCKNIVKTSTNVNQNATNASIGFFKDYLCSSEELSTNCGPTTNTKCFDGKDGVYFLDSCGNTANIYDASRINDKAYWNKVVKKEDSCGSGQSNANSPSCGNCDYLAGSYCRQAGNTGVQPTYGDYYCKDLSCPQASDGQNHKHGESWCVYDAAVGGGLDTVGSRYWRHICYAGEEMVEPCADFRQEYCLSNILDTSEGTFIQAGCVKNRWTSCTSQTREKDCNNTDQRDCYWEASTTINIGSGSSATTTPSTLPFNIGATTTTPPAAPTTTTSSSEVKETSCVPNIPPGLKFWQTGEAQTLCGLASKKCTVTYEEGLVTGGKKCISGCECLKEDWAPNQNNICKSLGDCGAYVNYLGKFSDNGMIWKVDGKEKALSQSIISQIVSNANAGGTS